MGSFSIWHWIIVLAIVVVIFGTKRLRSAGDDLGSAVKNFKSAMRDGEADARRHIEQAEQTAAEEVRLHPPEKAARS